MGENLAGREKKGSRDFNGGPSGIHEEVTPKSVLAGDGVDVAQEKRKQGGAFG